jgi:4-cresol dehydrogenase (hydroxylating)
MKAEIVALLEGIVGCKGLCAEPEEVARRTRNTLGLVRSSLGIVYPETAAQVQAIVRAANQHGLRLYAYSTAKNIGYGERLPVTEDNLIVDLGRMNVIVHVDSELGFVDVQPGVTQGQLSDHLRAQGVPFFADVTGSGRGSSIVGNAVEGGFGMTPLGNKRKQISCVEGVYGNGERFDTGTLPGGVGPDLAGLFVQSNFGIVTQLRVPLNPMTDDFRSMMINLPDQGDLLALVEALCELRQRGTLSSQVVITNALDALGASRTQIPEAWANQTLTNAAASEILSSPFGSFGALSAIGAVYGSECEVRAKCRTARRALRRRLARRASIRFMSGRTLDFLTALLSTWPFPKLAPTANLGRLLRSFREAHGMMQGIASDEALIGLMGAVRDTYEDTRLMWYSSRISTRSADVARFVEVASRCYERHGFEYPLEMLMVTANDIIAIQKIAWEKSDDEKRARDLYEGLARELQQAGFPPYRLGVQSQEQVLYAEAQRRSLQSLKQVFDPNGVISPGRYGIAASMPSLDRCR